MKKRALWTLAILTAVTMVLSLAAPTIAQDYGSMNRWKQNRKNPTAMQKPMQQQRRGQRQQASRRQSRRQMDQVQGQIQEMTTIKLADFDENHVIARIRTRQGQTAKVDLGPEKKINELNLQKGDQITVHGRSGTINEKQVLMAFRLDSGDQRVSIRRPGDKSMRRYSGEILKTRTVTMGQKNEQLVLARIRLDNGTTTMVNLGPTSQIANLNISSGQQVSMLARPVNISGRRALVVEQLQVDGKKVTDIDWRKRG